MLAVAHTLKRVYSTVRQLGKISKPANRLAKKVLLSLGGATGTYGFNDDSTAVEFATTLWELFGNGKGTAGRPFDGAIIDGFDFDIENHSQTGYVALVAALRDLFATDTSKQYYISASPQCVYPDASVGNILQNSDIDFAFIQFYNNWCNLGPNFNWNVWDDFAKNISPNKNIKMFIGLPGDSASASSGYLTPSSVSQYLTPDILQNPNFGGISLWDASSAWDNYDNSLNYIQNMKNLVAQYEAATKVSSTIPALPTTSDYTKLSTIPVISSTKITDSVVITVSTTPSTLATSTAISSVVPPKLSSSSSKPKTIVSSTVQLVPSSTTKSSILTPHTLSDPVTSTTSILTVVTSISKEQQSIASKDVSSKLFSDEQSVQSDTKSSSEPLPVLKTTSALPVLKSSDPAETFIATSTSIVDPVETTLSTFTPVITPVVTPTTTSSATTPTAFIYKVLTVIDGVTVVQTFTTTAFTTQYVTVLNK
jgi:chitinase